MTAARILGVATAAAPRGGPAVRASLIIAGYDVDDDPEWYGPPVGAETLAVVRLDGGALVVVRRLGARVWTLEASEPRRRSPP